MPIIEYRRFGDRAHREALEKIKKSKFFEYKEPLVFEKARSLDNVEKAEQLKRFDYIDGDVGVRFGTGFNDKKTYYSVDDLEK